MVDNKLRYALKIALNLPFAESTEVLHKLADQHFATGNVQKAITVSSRSMFNSGL